MNTTSPSGIAGNKNRFPQRWFAVGAIAMLAITSLGCGRETIERKFGKRANDGGSSVNGTGVLAGMFEQAGFQISTGRRLSPAIEKYQVIVWAPDNFSAPSTKERNYLEKWLANGSNRTLVFIGRDFDAAPMYWKKIQPLAPPKQAEEVARRLAKAQMKFDEDRAQLPKEEYARWFKMVRDKSKRRVDTLEGPWAKDIDAKKTEIELYSRFEVPATADIPTPGAVATIPAVPAVPATTPPTKVRPKPIVTKPSRRNRNHLPTFIDDLGDIEPEDLPNYRALLKSGNDIVIDRVSENHWNSSQIIVVTNGSMFLNLPLVNHEHRKLAAKLIDACGTPSKAVFLESGPEGVPISRNATESLTPPSGMALLTIWPINFILLHLAGLGIIGCFAVYPIFGRARTLAKDSVSDFGSHIHAIGELLEKSNDVAYATAQLNQYQEHVRRDSGQSHIKRKT